MIGAISIDEVVVKLRVPVKGRIEGVALWMRRIVIGSLHCFVKCGGGDGVGWVWGFVKGSASVEEEQVPPFLHSKEYVDFE